MDDLKVVKTTALKDAAYNVVEDSIENIRRKMGHYKQEFYRELAASSREIFKTELARDTAAVAFDIMVFTTAFLNRKADWQPSHPSPEYFIHYDEKDIEKLETQGYVVLKLRGYNAAGEITYDVVADNRAFFEKFIGPFMHPWHVPEVKKTTELSGDIEDLTAEELLEGEDLESKENDEDPIPEADLEEWAKRADSTAKPELVVDDNEDIIDDDPVPEEQLKEWADDAASGLSPYDILQKQMSKRISADLSGDVKLDETAEKQELDAAPEAVLSHIVDLDSGFLASLSAAENAQVPVASLTSSCESTCPGCYEMKGLSA